MDKPRSYADAGVDIERGDRFARFIAGIKSDAVSKGIGGFAGGIEIDTAKYRRPVLLSCTDGVGTKLLVAQKLKKFDTVGIDLVAMSVNDLIVCGASPMVFLDYIACGALDENVLHAIIAGIVEGCEQAECELAGGETAEMPDLYHGGDFDLAGFAVGIVDKDDMIPRKQDIREGDVILGMPSAGVHSNGLSLARKVIPENDAALYAKLLEPTKIYVKDLKAILPLKSVKGAAHVTGGGLEGNFQRVLPEGLSGSFTWDWKVPEIFGAIESIGGIPREEMKKVFNLGIGIALTVAADRAKETLDAAEKAGVALFPIGKVVRG